MARKTRQNLLGEAASAKKRIVWKVALYIRLSREDGGAESMSVVNQRAKLMNYLKTSFPGKYELINIFIDDGFSGTTFDRKEFQLMKEEILKGKIDCVIVTDVSRLGRNSSECGYYLGHFFTECGTRFISLDLPAVDSYLEPEQMNSIVLDFMNIVNEDFARQTSLKIRGTFKQKRSDGKFIGSFAPYGYKKDPLDKNALIIDEDAAQIVKMIYQMYVFEGMSKRGIMMKLNAMGIPCPTEYKRQGGSRYQNPQVKGRKSLRWSEITIASILKNQMYLGHMVQGKQRVKSYKVKKRERVAPDDWCIIENTHEPILDRELFDAAGKLGQRDAKTPGGENALHLFSGFLTCADCNRAMTRRSSKGHVYYSCRTYQDSRKNGSEPCKKHSIRLDCLENAVLTAIQMQIGLTVSLPEITAKVNASSRGGGKADMLEALIKERKDELWQYQRLCDGLYPDMKSGILTSEEYVRMKASYIEKIDQAERAVIKISEEREALKRTETVNHQRFEQFINHSNIEALDRHLLVSLVDRIYVHEGGRITIAFTYMNPHKQI